MTALPQFSLTTLGSVGLRTADGYSLEPVLAQSKRLALFVFLAAANGRAHRRDAVVSLFWPELDDEHARGALRQALSYLRRSLGAAAIVSRGDELAIDASYLEFDALKFEQSYARGDFANAMQLYNGDFLGGVFVDAAPELERWLEDERARLKRMAQEACSALARQEATAGRTGTAVQWARRALALAPANEAELRNLMQLLTDSGDRAGAVDLYESFSSRLALDYELEPSTETQLLVHQVRTQPAMIQHKPMRAVTADVRTSAGEAQAYPAPVGATPVRPRSPTMSYFTGIGLLALAGYVAILFAGRSADRNVNTRIAVLPIVDVERDSSLAYVAEGLTEQLITELAQLPGLDVINRRTMMEFGGSRLSTADILRKVNAHVLLAVTLQRLGDTVHMTAQLVRAGDERAFWARSFDGSGADLLRLQRNVALSAARGLQVAVPAQPNGARAVDPAALEYYIRARYAWNARSPAKLLQSIDLFRQALDVDPTFALAHSGIGDAYVQLGYGSLLHPQDAFPKARAAAQDALELDSTLAEPHATLAYVAMYHDWNWALARQEFERALARNPSYATAHEWYGLFETAMGRYEDAIAHERRAQELDPLSVPIAGTAGWVLYYSGRIDDAARELRVALRDNKDFALGHFYLGRVFEQQGKLDSALAQYAATGPLREWVPTVAAIGYVYGKQQRRAEARAMMARMDSLAQRGYATPYAYALVHAALGQPDSAFAWLERGVAERTHWLVWLNRDPRWNSLRSDARFAHLVRRIGLPD